MQTKISDVLSRTEIASLGTKQAVCEKHGEFLSTGQRFGVAGRREFWSECPACVAERKAAEEAKVAQAASERMRRQMEECLGQTMIPARFIGRTFDSYKVSTDLQRDALNACKAYAGDFQKALKTGASLVLSGKPGTGKSHLASAILQSLLPRYVGAYMTLMDLIRSVRETWRKDSELAESELLNKLSALPLLVIDEIGVQYGTDGERSIIFDVMDKRYREMRPTILMTNLDKENFRAAVGERVYDRLTEVGRWVAFDWPSYRTEARKEMRDA